MKAIVASCLAVTLAATTVEAGVKTTGHASFTVPTEIGDVIKPGTDDGIVIGGEQTQTEGVQLLHVPNFNFGQNALKAGGTFDAIFENYQEGENTVSYAIPHFVEVGDFSGDVGTNWRINVEQDSLFKAPTEQGHELVLSRIHLHNPTLTNNLKDVTALVTGPVMTAGYATIPVKGKDGGSLSILTSKGGQADATSTHGTISSVVFKKGYDSEDYGSKAAGAPSLADKNTDVKLSVPSVDTARAKAYSTSLTWTLTIEP